MKNELEQNLLIRKVFGNKAGKELLKDFYNLYVDGLCADDSHAKMYSQLGKAELVKDLLRIVYIEKGYVNKMYNDDPYDVNDNIGESYD